MNSISRIVRVLPAVVLWFGAAQASPRVRDVEHGPGAPATLREGTPVVLAFTGSLSSKTAANGDPVSLALASDLKVGGVTVAKAGCKVYGHTTLVKRAAVPGKSGALSLQLDYLQVGDAKIKLRNSMDQKAATEVQYSRPYHLKWPMGLLRTGDDIEIKSGTMLTVFVAEDFSLPAAE